jgi:hypothetical protein
LMIFYHFKFCNLKFNKFKQKFETPNLVLVCGRKTSYKFWLEIKMRKPLLMFMFLFSYLEHLHVCIKMGKITTFITKRGLLWCNDLIIACKRSQVRFMLETKILLVSFLFDKIRNGILNWDKHTYLSCWFAHFLVFKRWQVRSLCTTLIFAIFFIFGKLTLCTTIIFAIFLFLVNSRINHDTAKPSHKDNKYCHKKINWSNNQIYYKIMLIPLVC